MSQDEFNRLIAEAGERVKVGGEYAHYKDPERMRYRVVTLAVDEATERACVVYQPLYNDGPPWIRTVDNFLETVETADGPKPRFRLTEN